MKIIYQGQSVETDAKTVDPAKAIVEYSGEVYAPGSDLCALPLEDGATLDVFKLTAGG